MRFVSSYGADDFVQVASIEVKDVPGGVFQVKADGTITLMSGSYRNIGQIWKPGSSSYNTLLANLSDVRGNRPRIEALLGTKKVEDAVAARGYTPPAAPGYTEEPKGALEGVDPAASWVLPVAVASVATLAGGLIIFFRGTEAGRKKWAQLFKRR